MRSPVVVSGAGVIAAAQQSACRRHSRQRFEFTVHPRSRFAVAGPGACCCPTTGRQDDPGRQLAIPELSLSGPGAWPTRVLSIMAAWFAQTGIDAVGSVRGGTGVRATRLALPVAGLAPPLAAAISERIAVLPFDRG